MQQQKHGVNDPLPPVPRAAGGLCVAASGTEAGRPRLGGAWARALIIMATSTSSSPVPTRAVFSQLLARWRAAPMPALLVHGRFCCRTPRPLPGAVGQRHARAPRSAYVTEPGRTGFDVAGAKEYPASQGGAAGGGFRPAAASWSDWPLELAARRQPCAFPNPRPAAVRGVGGLARSKRRVSAWYRGRS